MKISRRVILSDLRSISPEEFNTARQICEKIQNIKESRAGYIKDHNLDSDIALPAANWAEDAANSIHDLYQLVVTCKYDVINRLRLYTQPFSGYQLTVMSDGIGKTPVLYPLPDNFDEELAKIAPKPDHWVYKYSIITQNLPDGVIAKAPKILGEIGWDLNGNLVNADTYAYQERINLLYEEGIIDFLNRKAEGMSGVNILEIGAGYGGLAYHLKRSIPQVNYYICDIPESLLFSALYLALAYPDCKHTIYDGIDKTGLSKSDSGFKFIANYMFDDLAAADVRIDLAINTLSFSEMSEKQVRFYAQSLKDMLGDCGILFEQNKDNRQVGFIHSKLYLPEYFEFQKTIQSNSIPALTHGGADIWANKPPDIVTRRIKKWIFTRHFGAGLRWWLPYKITSVIRTNRFAKIRRFIQTRTRLYAFLQRFLRIIGGETD